MGKYKISDGCPSLVISEPVSFRVQADWYEEQGNSICAMERRLEADFLDDLSQVIDKYVENKTQLGHWHNIRNANLPGRWRVEMRAGHYLSRCSVRIRFVSGRFPRHIDAFFRDRVRYLDISTDQYGAKILQAGLRMYREIVMEAPIWKVRHDLLVESDDIDQEYLGDFARLRASGVRYLDMVECLYWIEKIQTHNAWREQVRRNILKMEIING